MPPAARPIGRLALDGLLAHEVGQRAFVGQHAFAQVLRHLGLHLHGGLQAVERVLPALLRVAVHLIAADGGGVLLRVQALERPDPCSARRRPALGLAISRCVVARLARRRPTTLNGRLARLRAWFISICASFWSCLIWLLICSSVRMAVSVFCTRLDGIERPSAPARLVASISDAGDGGGETEARGSSWRVLLWVGSEERSEEGRQQVGGPIEAAMAQPGGRRSRERRPASRARASMSRWSCGVDAPAKASAAAPGRGRTGDCRGGIGSSSRAWAARWRRSRSGGC
jgi:hypothetical protein